MSLGFFSTFHLNQEYFFVKSSGDEWVWKPVFLHPYFLTYRLALSFPLRRSHSKGKGRYPNPKQMATLPQCLEKSYHLVVLVVLIWKRFCFVLVWKPIHHLLSVSPHTFPAILECLGQDRSGSLLLCMLGSGNS